MTSQPRRLVLFTVTALRFSRLKFCFMCIYFTTLLTCCQYLTYEWICVRLLFCENIFWSFIFRWYLRRGIVYSLFLCLFSVELSLCWEAELDIWLLEWLSLVTENKFVIASLLLCEAQGIILPEELLYIYVIISYSSSFSGPPPLP